MVALLVPSLIPLFSGLLLLQAALVQHAPPHISRLPVRDQPHGCNYALVDRNGTIRAWAPYAGETSPQSNVLVIAIDGTVRRLPITSRSDRQLLAAGGTFAVSIATPRWTRVDTELEQAAASLRLSNTGAHTKAVFHLKALRGC
jgi:hypothetical protein